MQYEGIDIFLLPVASPDEAAAPFERLGLRLTPLVRPAELKTGFRFLPIGGAENLLAVELLATVDTALPAGTPGIALRVPDLDAAVRELEGRGVAARRLSFTDAQGNPLLEIALLDVVAKAGVYVALSHFPRSTSERSGELQRQGTLAHALPLKRVDHIAAMAPDLEGTVAYWGEVLGVPLHGEVRTAVMIIKQLRIGDVNLELIGPASPESPLAGRPPGLMSMVACEVDDVASAVAQVRAAGFTAPDPAPGPLPGTLTSSIPAGELGGLGLQLLQYVQRA